MDGFYINAKLMLYFFEHLLGVDSKRIQKF